MQQSSSGLWMGRWSAIISLCIDIYNETVEIDLTWSYENTKQTFLSIITVIIAQPWIHPRLNSFLDPPQSDGVGCNQFRRRVLIELTSRYCTERNYKYNVQRMVTNCNGSWPICDLTGQDNDQRSLIGSILGQITNKSVHVKIRQYHGWLAMLITIL